MPPLYLVDAFTNRPFAGNPAAVVLLDDGRDDRWMQAVAAEMNQAETAFVLPPPADSRSSTDGAPFALRWFTPAAEVELCGHATLASAHLLWELGHAAPDRPIHFHTRYRGTLTCTRADAAPPDGPPRITMRFPADPATDQPPPPGLIQTLGVAPVRTARSRYDWIIELATADEVRRAEPDFAALARFETRGVALTAANPSASPDQPDVVSRFFAPRLRIDEDAVTGSLHCVLGPYWSPRLGKPTLSCEQASPRGGFLQVTLRGADHVDLAGQAVTTTRGELLA